MLKLHIGGGGFWMSGWVHLDKAWAIAPDGIEFIQLDVRQGLPYQDGAVDLIYASHFLDHLDAESVVPFLGQCHRVLRLGGVARFAVMDVEKLVKAYQEQRMGSFDYCQPAFYKGIKSQGLKFGLFAAGSLSGRKDYTGHYWISDYDGVAELLSRAGFTDIHNMASGESLSATIRAEVKDTYQDHTIYVEARK